MFKVVIGALIGGTAGFLVYKFIGCGSGTCPIWANPYSSVIFGIVLGIAIAAIK